MPRVALDRVADRGETRIDGRDQFRKRRRERRDRADRPFLEPASDESLGPDEHVEPDTEVPGESFVRRVRDLETGQIRRLLPEPPQDTHRHGIPARALELVDVERKRRAGARGRREVRQQRRLVQLEVRRPDHGHAGGPERGGMLGECDRGGGRLRARVDDHVERSLDEQLGHPPALLDAEQEPLPRRAERQEPVETARGQELDERTECVLVESRTAVPERRCGRGERPSLHPENVKDPSRRPPGPLHSRQTR